MAEKTTIEWTATINADGTKTEGATFNPWRGCTKLSAGCANCYADTLSNRNPRTLGIWGKNGTRVVASETMWRQPLKWNREAEETGVRKRVFCASLADVFEGRDTMPESAWEAVEAARLRLFDLIRQTPHLDWLLLTKRPENIKAAIHRAFRHHAELCESDACPTSEQVALWKWLTRWDAKFASSPENVWLGTSVENQAAADERIPHLLQVPAKVRFLSCEPLLGAVDLMPCLGAPVGNALRKMEGLEWMNKLSPRIDWVIAGGESGPNARPMHPDWARSLQQQCAAAGVPFLFKQWGEWRPPLDGEEYNTRGGRMAKPPAFIMSESGTVHCFQSDVIVNGKVVIRVGKKAAGRLLDGREWNQMPEVTR